MIQKIFEFYEASFQIQEEKEFLNLLTNLFEAKDTFLFWIPDTMSVLLRETGSGITNRKFRQTHKDWISLLSEDFSFSYVSKVPRGNFDPLKELEIQSGFVWSIKTKSLGERFFILVGFSGLIPDLDSKVSMGKSLLPCLQKWIENTQLVSSYERIIDRFQTVMDTVEQPVIYVDAKSGSSWINPSASDLLGVPPGEQESDTLSLAMSELLKRSETAIEPFLKDKDSDQRPKVFHLELKEPKSQIFEVHTRHTKSGAGKVWFFQDTTDSVLLNRTLQEKSETKLLLASKVSHEIRNPLTGILGLTESLLDSPLSVEQKETLELVFRSGKMLLNLVNEFLDLSKLEFQKLELDLFPTKPQEVIKDAVLLLDPNRKSRNNEIIFNSKISEGETFLMDGLRLSQITINLLSNAIKFTKSGKIWVDLEKQSNPDQGDFLVLKIKDSGIGMPQEKLQNLFKPFHQTETSISRLYGGTGLGLSICKNLVELMNGTIAVTSELDKGTMFIVTLPIQKAEHLHLTEITSLHSYNPNLKILIIEDDPTNTTLIQRILHKLGVTARMEASGTDGFQAFPEQDYDLVLLDNSLPGMTGEEVALAIRETYKDWKGKLIAFTAEDPTEFRSKKSFALYDDFFPKPFSLDLWRALLAKYS